MSDESIQGGTQADWQQTLDALERSLRQSLHAVNALRQSMMAGSRLQQPASEEDDDAPYDAPEETTATTGEPEPAAGPGRSPFERLWDRMEEEREAQAQTEPRRKGLAALPTQYVFTIEDVEGRADLVALHRGFQGLAAVREISLMSFVNGVPIVSVTVERELDLAKLGETIGEATDRICDVMTQDGPKVHVRLRSRTEGAA